MITDQPDSLCTIVDSQTGSTAEEITYDPFGRILRDTNQGFQPFGFAGGKRSGHEPAANVPVLVVHGFAGAWMATGLAWELGLGIGSALNARYGPC